MRLSFAINLPDGLPDICCLLRFTVCLSFSRGICVSFLQDNISVRPNGNLFRVSSHKVPQKNIGAGDLAHIGNRELSFNMIIADSVSGLRSLHFPAPLHDIITAARRRFVIIRSGNIRFAGSIRIIRRMRF